MQSKLYLACPYSHRLPEVRAMRVYYATKVAAKLQQAGYVVFSPLTHSHHTVAFMDERFVVDHDFWWQQNVAFLEWADQMAIYKLPGWKQSAGVRAERKWMRDNGKVVWFIKHEFGEEFGREQEREA